ncbi:hypothetical protein Asulf_01300 [Archaeoglobus sulfaticallidus PM70-1]|uniref:Uncharacterized protein n=1 Tax=Archaeoglobus sulfaticallidus PM70-1 TaxID=387631 RepID=N0BE49_9EURY|nr:hypothetical protein [Archaeoglobus sulfaticallidus]AGK61293.1 hypothetical protein Asulf_01300 [Archaeoglobus sulfaticallidus PM70-1]
MLHTRWLVKRKLDVRPLKKFALKLPEGFALKEVLLMERDEITAEEAIIKVEIWTRLLEMDLWRMERPEMEMRRNIRVLK